MEKSKKIEVKPQWRDHCSMHTLGTNKHHWRNTFWESQSSFFFFKICFQCLVLFLSVENIPSTYYLNKIKLTEQVKIRHSRLTLYPLSSLRLWDAVIITPATALSSWTAYGWKNKKMYQSSIIPLYLLDIHTFYMNVTWLNDAGGYLGINNLRSYQLQVWWVRSISNTCSSTTTQLSPWMVFPSNLILLIGITISYSFVIQ